MRENRTLKLLQQQGGVWWGVVLFPCVALLPCVRARARTTRVLGLVLHVGVGVCPETRMSYFVGCVSCLQYTEIRGRLIFEYFSRIDGKDHKNRKHLTDTASYLRRNVRNHPESLLCHASTAAFSALTTKYTLSFGNAGSDSWRPSHSCTAHGTACPT